MARFMKCLAEKSNSDVYPFEIYTKIALTLLVNESYQMIVLLNSFTRKSANQLSIHIFYALFHDSFHMIRCFSILSSQWCYQQNLTTNRHASKLAGNIKFLFSHLFLGSRIKINTLIIFQPLVILNSIFFKNPFCVKLSLQ